MKHADVFVFIVLRLVFYKKKRRLPRRCRKRKGSRRRTVSPRRLRRSEDKGVFINRDRNTHKSNFALEMFFILLVMLSFVERSRGQSCRRKESGRREERSRKDERCLVDVFVEFVFVSEGDDERQSRSSRRRRWWQRSEHKESEVLDTISTERCVSCTLYVLVFFFFFRCYLRRVQKISILPIHLYLAVKYSSEHGFCLPVRKFCAKFEYEARSSPGTKSNC